MDPPQLPSIRKKEAGAVRTGNPLKSFVVFFGIL